MITKTNRIDMTPGGAPLVIRLSQYDSDFTLVFNLYASDGTFTIESSTTAAIRGMKPDGNGYSADATIDISNKKVTVAGDDQITAVAGKGEYELVLSKSGYEINTANFIILTERAAMDQDTFPSNSVIKELVDVIDRTDEIIEAADKADAAIHAYTLIIQDAYPVSGATPLSSGWLEDEDGDVIVPDADHVYVLKEASSPYAVGDQFRWSGSTYVEVLDGGGSSVPKTSTTPKMDGTAAIGSETAYAAGDHVHPTDTTRAPLASPAFTGTPTAPTANASTDSTQIATTAFVHDVADGLVTGVSDVEVDGTSVVTSGIAGITSPNAFANVKVGSSTIAADQKDDTLELEAGSNISLTADTTNDKVTIAGNYPTATTSADGLMSSTDKAAVDMIGDTPMGTTATTLTGAIAEHETVISNLNSNLAESYGTGTIDTTYATESSCEWVKKNGMVCIPIGLHLKNITTFQTRKIGQGFPPSNGVKYCVSYICKNDAPFLGTMQVNASGDLEIVTRGSSFSSSADTVTGQLMYIAK